MRRLRKRIKLNSGQETEMNGLPKVDEKDFVFAPEDFRLITNTDECLKFFLRLRDADNIKLVRTSQSNKRRYIRMSLKKVNQIDDAAISILTAISEDYRLGGVILHGDFTNNNECNTRLMESGYINHITDPNGKKLPYFGASGSDIFKLEKGTGALTDSEHSKISKILKTITARLGYDNIFFKRLKTLVLEICGNSIEWSGSYSKLWLMGVNYRPDMVYCTLTDIGNGILETLHIKAKQKTWDFFHGKSNIQILEGAFERKYGSTTREPNRNNGLPHVKYCFETNFIQNLKVITNDVILDFNSPDACCRFGEGTNFKGTFYQWELKAANNQ